MRVSNPRIVEPVTACGHLVRLLGQRSGAVIRIERRRGSGPWKEIYRGQASGPNEVLVLTEPMAAGDQLRAWQEGGETSEATTVVVNPGPSAAELGHVVVSGTLHAFGQRTAIGNASAGAVVEVRTTTGDILGREETDPRTGSARVSFARPPKPTDVLEAQSSLCGISGPVTQLPAPVMPFRPDGKMLSAPQIRVHPVECDTAVAIEGIYEGAIVTLLRDDQIEAEIAHDYKAMWFPLKRPLAFKEKLNVQQRFNADLFSRVSLDVWVGELEATGAPELLGPGCFGANTMRVSGLRHGASVRIEQLKSRDGDGGVVIGEVEAWDTVCDVPLFGPVSEAKGRFVRAVMQTCGKLRPASNVLKLRKEALPKQFITLDGLVECSGMVRVKNVHPGSRIEVWGTCAAAPKARLLGVEYVFAEEGDIAVAPSLFKGQGVWVVQRGCGRTVTSDKQWVQDRPALEQLTLVDLGKSVLVKNFVPGAWVHLFANDSQVASGRTAGRVLELPLPADLRDETMLKARQVLCNLVSDFSVPVPYFSGRVRRRLECRAAADTTMVRRLTGLGNASNSDEAGVFGTDLGIPIEHSNGRLYFFFGDTNLLSDDLKNLAWLEVRIIDPIGALRKAGLLPDNRSSADVIAYTTATKATDPALRLTFPLVARPDDDGRAPAVLTVPFEYMGGLCVPTGGFSHNGHLYVFVAVEGNANEEGQEAAPMLTRFRPVDGAWMKRSILVKARQPTDIFPVVPGHERISAWEGLGRLDTFKFVQIAAAKIRNDDWPGLPSNARPGGEGVILLGGGLYRQSPPYLAYVPLEQGKDPSFADWRYLMETDRNARMGAPCGQPVWSASQKDATPLWQDALEEWDQDSKQWEPNPQDGLGESSICYVPELRLWIAVYNLFKIVLRTAPAPWGPWSKPTTIFEFGAQRPDYFDEGGAAYGPYVVPRWTEVDKDERALTIYYTMSTWRPYNVVLMRTRLREISVDDETWCPTKKR